MHKFSSVVLIAGSSTVKEIHKRTRKLKTLCESKVFNVRRYRYRMSYQFLRYQIYHKISF